MVEEWQVLERRPSADYKIFQIETKKVRSPRTNGVMDVQAIHFPDWVVVLPVTKDKKIVMVRQYRHGTEQISLELPGGLIDPDDASPQSAGLRELVEETGYRAKMVTSLGVIYPQPAVLSNRCYFYLAQDVEPAGPMDLGEGEDIGLELVPLSSMAEKISRCEIDNAMTIVAFSFYRNDDFRSKEGCS